ncbi:MAG: hypothetical protein AAF581_15325 [Planctomycetota bacterium]
MKLLAATLTIGCLAIGELPTQNLAIGDRQLPVIATTPSEPHPLTEIEQHLRAGRYVQGAELLRDFVPSCGGRLLAPPGNWLAPRRWGRLGAPDEVLREWFDTLRTDPAIELPLFVIPENLAQTRNDVAPILWHPGLRSELRRERDLALESNDIGAAWRLTRSLQPERTQPSPVEATLLAAITQALPTSPLVHAFQPLPQSLELALRIPLSTTSEVATPQSNAHGAPPGRHRKPPQYVPTYPLIVDDTAVIVTGMRARGIAIGTEPRVAWDQQLATMTEGLQPALVHVPIAPQALAEFLLIPARTTATATPRPSPRAARWPRSWLQWRALLRQPPRPPVATAGPLQQLFDAATRHGTVVAQPLQTRGRVYLLVAAGWQQCTLHLLCGDAGTGRLLWTRKLGATQHQWHSSRDLRTLLPTGQLLRYGDDIIVSTGRGFLSRVDATTGSYRGVILYESWGYAGLPFTQQLSVGNVELRTLPRPAVRPPSPILLDTATGTPLLTLLPDDSQHVLAIDLAAWNVHWAHGPVQRFATLFPAGAREVLILDGDASAGARHAPARFVDRSSGRVVHESGLALPASPQENAALLNGPPLLVGATVVVSTPTGIGHVPLAALRRDAAPAITLCSWPRGSRGGCLAPLPNGQWLAITAGTTDEEPAAIEIYQEITKGGGDAGRENED